MSYIYQITRLARHRRGFVEDIAQTIVPFRVLGSSNWDKLSDDSLLRNESEDVYRRGEASCG